MGLKEQQQEVKVAKRATTRYTPDYNLGLTRTQVEKHEHDGWTNVTVRSTDRTTKQIVLNNLLTYFNLIFAVLAVILILVGSFRSLTFLPVIIGNILIGIVQEIRAKKVLDEMQMLNAPSANVVREGKIYKVASDKLVLDDIVIFKAGNQICADAVVISGNVQVDESLLTGEADEIAKRPGDNLMSGSFIVSGECYARLDKVGEDSYISKLALEAKKMPKGEQSEMIRSLNRLVKYVGIALIPIGIALFGQACFWNGETVRDSVVSMVAAVIGMIPEGLYLLASVALATSSMRLAKNKVLLHDMKSIETLARVNVLCVDKTGTITENRMEVKELVPVKNDDTENTPDLQELIGDFVSAMKDENNTMKALKGYFTKTSGRKAQSVCPFNSSVKYSGAAFADKTYVIGAPEFVLREAYSEHEDEILEYVKKGYRVLVFAEYDGELDGKQLTGKALPLAYVMLANAIRKEAPGTFHYFAEQGVQIKVISGDNPMTVSEIAREAGIEGADSFVDAQTLTTEEEIASAVSRYTVFGRVTPEQKRAFVKALQKQGNTVAMTGDGVNDVLALKDADCSIAMASGSDAAVQASQVVLLESDFSRMPSVVMEGRRVVNNIQRTASLFLVKNIFSFLLSLLSVAFMYTYPLEPSQISLISMFTIGIPGFFLTFQPNKEIIKGKFLSNVILRALPAALTDVIVVAAMVVFGETFGVASADISTAATMLLAIIGFVYGLFQ